MDILDENNLYQLFTFQLQAAARPLINNVGLDVSPNGYHEAKRIVIENITEIVQDFIENYYNGEMVSMRHLPSVLNLSSAPEEVKFLIPISWIRSVTLKILIDLIPNNYQPLIPMVNTEINEFLLPYVNKLVLSLGAYAGEDVLNNQMEGYPSKIYAINIKAALLELMKLQLWPNSNLRILEDDTDEEDEGIVLAEVGPDEFAVYFDDTIDGLDPNIVIDEQNYNWTNYY